MVSYYIIFAELYSLSLRSADVIMVNSTWTHNHVERLLYPLWRRDDSDAVMEPPHILTSAPVDTPGSQIRQRRLSRSTPLPPTPSLSERQRAFIVYPSCDTDSLSALPLEPRELIILSVAQFR